MWIRSASIRNKFIYCNMYLQKYFYFDLIFWFVCISLDPGKNPIIEIHKVVVLFSSSNNLQWDFSWGSRKCNFVYICCDIYIHIRFFFSRIWVVVSFFSLIYKFIGFCIFESYELAFKKSFPKSKDKISFRTKMK